MANQIVYLDDKSFNGVIERGVTLVDFFAEWCGPCRMIAPILEKLAQDYAGRAAIGKLDIEQSPSITSKYGVTSIPTLILFKNGQEFKRVVGLRDEDALKTLIDSALA